MNPTPKRIFTGLYIFATAVVVVIAVAREWTLPAFLTVMLPLAGLFILGALAIDIIWLRRTNTKLHALATELKDRGDPEAYIRGVDALLRDAKSPQLRNVRHINIGAALTDMHRNADAEAHLTQVDPRKLAGASKLVYYADLALVYFRQSKIAPARSALTAGDLFARRAKLDPSPLATLIDLLGVYDLHADGRIAEATAALDALEPTVAPQQAPEVAHLRALLADPTDPTDPAPEARP